MGSFLCKHTIGDIMKKLLIGLMLVLCLATQVTATIPEGYTLDSWFNQIVTDLSMMNSKLSVYREDWALLPSGVKDGVKARVLTQIDEAIVQLTELKIDIQAISN